ncbi:6-O-methylguanine DNA methyltransferase [Gautieria morchelliformis]|nr:6-O-methylguanine DNA methyltransferase [Gautieria morchelliformis]
MPATRTLKLSLVANAGSQGKTVVVANEDQVVDLAKCNVQYPLDDATRRVFKTKEGKRPTAHQWAVYDLVRKIPVGKVTTYKDICVALGQGSPRSVGAALRNNPFAPFVPCHRIIASNHYIGGFYGEWGQSAGTGKQYHRKLDMLGKEGIAFTDKGYLVGGDAFIWRG